MKKILRLFICLLLFHSGLSHANQATSSAASSVLVVGAVAAVGSTVHRGLFQDELAEWKDGTNDTTAVLDSQCGLNVELRILGNARLNYLYVGLKNETPNSVVFKPSEFKMAFSEGRERAPFGAAQIGDIEIKPGWRVLMPVIFPSKWDFKDQSSLDVKIPVYSFGGKPICTVQTRMEKNPEKPIETSSFIERSVMDFSFEFGSSFLRTGGMKSLGDTTNFTFGISVYLYPHVHSGLFFQVFGEGFSNASQSLLAGTGSASGTLTGTFGAIGYSYRGYLSKDWSFTYDLGVGGYTYRVGRSTGSTPESVSSSFAATQKFSVDYVFGRIRVPSTFFFDNNIGLSIYQVWNPRGSIGVVDASGNSFGALLRYKFGI